MTSNLLKHGSVEKNNNKIFLIDSHCHLEYYEEDELATIMQNCHENNVRILNNICIDIRHFDKIAIRTRQYDFIFCSLGTHPCHVDDEVVTAQDIMAIYQQHTDRIIGIGETGLDFFRNDDPLQTARQQQSFQAHIEASSAIDLPLIIHTRDAELATYQMLKSDAAVSKVRGVIHCFTGSKDFLFKMLELGFYISISGIVTFKNATALQEIAKLIPIDRLLLETDSPYLAPTPFRGARNEPSFVKYTAEFLAATLSIDYEDLLQQTTKNFFEIFTKADPSVATKA